MGEVPVSEVELASAIEKWTGVDAAAYAAERIDALSRAENEDGVRRFRAVAAELGRMRELAQA